VLDSAGSGLFPGGGGGGGLLRAAAAGVTRGYNGSQVFNTLYASSDPSEPQHCGLVGGASYWYAYTPPADGMLVLDTIGSSFDTFIAVYTFAPPLTGYADLIAIACDNDGANSNGAARLEFAAPRNRSFIVVVDGIDGARGLARLNYLLDTNRPPSVPVLTAPQSPLAAAVGGDVALAPSVTGSAPLRFQWRKGGEIIPGATNRMFALSSLTLAHSGEYSVTVSNHVGGPMVVSIPLRVLLPPQSKVEALSNGAFVWSFVGVVGQDYSVEEAEEPDGPWRGASSIFSGNDSSITLTNPPGGAARFFRLRVQ
jgi:Immunoglobulin domain